MMHVDKRSEVDRRCGKDRRSGVERRSGKDTRTDAAKRLLGEQRSGKDRRSGEDRRKRYLINYRITHLYKDGRESVVRFGETIITSDDADDPVAQFERDFEKNYQSPPECEPVVQVYHVAEVGTLAAPQ